MNKSQCAEKFESQELTMNAIKRSLLIGLATTSTLLGCATQRPFAYKADSSLAMNVAVAAGMDQGLQDVIVPKESLKSEGGDLALGVASGAAGLASPVGNLSNAQAGALNLASWLISPGKPSNQPAIIGWMPQKGQSAEDAQKEMGNILADGVERIYKEMNLTVKKGSGNIRKFYNTNVMASGKTTCADLEGKSTCSNGFLVSMPESVTGTLGFTESDKNWLFKNEIGYHTFIIRDKPNDGLSDFEFMKRLSSNLPGWIYMYFPPKSLSQESGDKINYPIFLNKGNIHLFIKKGVY